MAMPRASSKCGSLAGFSRVACAVIVAVLASVFSASHACAQIVLSGVSASVQAQASPLLNPSGSVSISAPPATLPLTVQSTNDGSPQNPGHAFAMASVTGGYDPTVSVSVSAIGETTTNPNATGSFIAGATAILNYSFVITGPTTAGTIPVLAQGNSSISQNIYTGFNSVQIFTQLYVNNGSVLNSTGGPFNTTLNLHVGTVYNVHMEASAAVQVLPNQAEAIAFVDPSFTIDPSFSNAYSISYSDGLIQAGAMPRGDFNLDHHVDANDIKAMLNALTDLNKFQTANGLSVADVLAIGDINGDGQITNADLQPLLTLLKSGGGSLAAVPEPASIVLLAFALPGLVITVTRRRDR
jgi:hypothetical protein